MRQARTKSAKTNRLEDRYLRRQERLHCRRNELLRRLKGRQRRFQQRRSTRQTNKSRCAPTSFPSVGVDSLFPATRTQIGSKPNASSWPKSRIDVVTATLRAEREISYSGVENSVPGKHSLIFSTSRLIANGFAINPPTPGSFNNSCARFSSAWPETRINGGTSLIG